MRISPLRQRMIGDMTARHFGEKAQKDYIRHVKNFTAFLGRSPETADIEDLRRFRLHLIDSSLSASSVNTAMQALRFFFSITLDKPGLLKALFRVQAPQKLPTVLTQEEVARLLDAAPGAKYKAALSVAYGAGLRASEVLSLKVSDIDSARMLLRVEQGKGRSAQVAPCGSAPLRRPPRHAFSHAARYFAGVVAHRQAGGLAVSGAEPGQPIDHAAVEPHLPRGSPCGGDQEACFAAHAAAQLCDAPFGAGYRYPGHPEPAPVKTGVLLGHAKLNTTALYTRVATSTIRKVMSPLDRLSLIEKRKDQRSSSAERDSASKDEPKA